MKNNLIKLIAVLCVLCMFISILSSCAGEVTETESQSESESVTESQSESESVSESLSESESVSESLSESESVSETETESETPRETLDLKSETVIDGFAADSWSFDYAEVNMNGSTPPADEGNPAPFIDAEGNIMANGKSRFTATLNSLQTLDHGFRLTVTTNLNSTVAADATYWGSSYIIAVGDFALVIKNAFHELYDGAAPVVLELYEGFELVSGYDDYTANGTLIAEHYTEAWATNNTVNDEVLSYMNATWTIDCKDGIVSVTNDTNGTIEWELWNGDSSTEVEIETREFTDATIAFYKSWGGYVQGDNTPYYSSFVLEKYVPAE